MKIKELTIKANKMFIKLLYVVTAILLFYIGKLYFIDFLSGHMTEDKIFYLVMSIFCTFYSLFYAVMTSSTLKVLEKCRVYIEGKERVEFSMLASLLNKDVYTIKSEFKIMIENDFFSNVEIDEEGIYIKEPDYIAIKCECCGGITMIEVDGGGVCDYCRAPIGKYEK